VRTTNRHFVWTALAMVIVMAATGSVWAESGSSDEEQKWSFGTGIDARLRYELVDDDARPERANAVTLRTRLFFTAARDNYGSALVEFEDVRQFGNNRFDSTANGMNNFGVVADPDATEINRAWYRYEAPAPCGVALKVGRQVVNRDRGRILGDVGWRQNQQTFDALTLERSEGMFRVWSGYLGRANRIFGDQHPNPVNRQFKLNGWVGEGAVHLDPGAITAIVQYFEFKNDPTTALMSHRNLGLRWDGRHQIEDKGNIEYRAQWIDQGSHADGAAGNEADYFVAEVGYRAKRWGVGVHGELLGGDGNYGFQRPLATLHAYNGWADRFLNTPGDGLLDLFIDGKVKVKDWTLSGQLHRFESDNGDLHYGDELGLAAAHKLCKNFDVVLKYAGHRAVDVGNHVHKFWFSVRYADKFALKRH